MIDVHVFFTACIRLNDHEHNDTFISILKLS